MNNALSLLFVLASAPVGLHGQGGSGVDFHVTTLADGASEVEIVNQSSEPITALAVVAEGELGSYVGSTRPTTVYYYDSVRHYWKDRPIGPGGRWQIRIGALPAATTVVSLKAAISDSGFVHGDAEWAAKIVRLRQFCMQKASIAIEELRRLRSSATSRQELIERFTALNELGMRTADREERGAVIEVFGTVLGNLRRDTGSDGSPVPWEETVRAGIGKLLDLHQRLSLSRPTLTTTSVE